MCVPRLRFRSLSLSENLLFRLVEFGLFTWNSRNVTNLKLNLVLCYRTPYETNPKNRSSQREIAHVVKGLSGLYWPTLTSARTVYKEAETSQFYAEYQREISQTVKKKRSRTVTARKYRPICQMLSINVVLWRRRWSNWNSSKLEMSRTVNWSRKKQLEAIRQVDRSLIAVTHMVRQVVKCQYQSGFVWSKGRVLKLKCAGVPTPKFYFSIAVH